MTRVSEAIVTPPGTGSTASAGRSSEIRTSPVPSETSPDLGSSEP